MAFSDIGPREVCILLMAMSAVVLFLRPRTAVARVTWLGLLAAGIANALVLNAQPYNLMQSNLVHYYLGAKYPVPYQNFYRAINAALERPQINMRDLERPDRMVRAQPNEQRAYYIDLMRGQGVEFDPLGSLEELAARARETGALRREAQRILSENLPASRVDAFRRDVRKAVSAVFGRDVVHDVGFNGSPFYALVRHADPTLYAPIGPATAWLNLVWQIIAVIVLAWVMGLALGAEIEDRLAMASLVFASWDFVSFALPGLIFAGFWLPVAFALYALRRGAALYAGVGIAWAGLVKLFPFILLLPAAVRLARARLAAASKTAVASQRALWHRLPAWCAGATVVFAIAATFAGRSWSDFFDKILAQFVSESSAGNNVSLARTLSALGIDGRVLPSVLAIASMAVLAAMFLREREENVLATLPRRSLVLLAATGWVAHMWLNYYSVAALLPLPVLARRRRIGAAAAALAMGVSFILPDFDDPSLPASPALLSLKLAPYALIPAWLVFGEFKTMGLSRRARRLVAVVCAAVVLVIGCEAGRMHAVRSSIGAGRACLDRGDTKGALEHYERLVRLAPRHDAGYNGKAVAYAIGKDASNARVNFERAIRLNPNHAPLRQNFGRFLSLTGADDEAARELEIANRLSPFDESILVDLARVRLRQGRRAEAESLLARALELRPADRTIRGLLEESRMSAP